MSESKKERHHWTIEGMTCSNCALNVSKAVKKAGGEDVNVNFSTGEARFKTASSQNLSPIKNRIEKLGYRVKSASSSNHHQESRLTPLEKRFYFCLIFTIPLFLHMFIPWSPLHHPLVQLGLSIPVVIAGLAHFGKSAFYSLKGGSPNMDVLITIGASAAFIYSLTGTLLQLGPQYQFYETAAMILTLVLFGNVLEQRSVKRTTHAIQALTNLQPSQAKRIIKGDTEEQKKIEKISYDAIQEGDLLQVNTGDRIPVDGKVKKGQGSVDESMITGESAPVQKGYGDKVVGSTVLKSGNFVIEATAIGEATVLSQIIEMVKNAQERKPQLQQLADKVSAIFVPAVLLVALLTFTLSFWLFQIGLQQALMNSIAVLVIACPCALGLATPTAVMVGIGKAAQKGILIKKADIIEGTSKIKNIVFDKTGTLTEGEHGVVGMETVDGVDEDEAFALAAAVEGDSEHMIARAIREAADEREISVPAATDFEAMKGRGVRAYVDGDEMFVGGPNLLNHLDSDVPSDLNAFAEKAGANAQTVVYLVREGDLIAAFAMADVIRDDSYRVVDALHNLDIEVAMLTGDSRDVANAVAEELGIDTVFAEVLPEEKDEKVQELQDQGKLVGMVGDGVNDAPALTRADVGIAIGSGTDVAVQSADVILVQNNPMDVVRLVKLSKASYRKMQENIVWAAGYNVFAIPLAAGVLAPIGILLSPAVGALLMSLSTVIVAVNAQLLRRVDLSVPGLPDVSTPGRSKPAD
jgi:Cu2+-exporting ATPase